MVYTNLSGCHGTSGAGVFAHDIQRGVYRLLRPVVTGFTNDSPAGPLMCSSFDVAQIPEAAAATVTVDKLDQPWSCSGATCSTWERFRFIDEPTLGIPPGDSVTIPGLELLPRTRYRFSVRAHDHYFDRLVPDISVRISPLPDLMLSSTLDRKC